MNTLQSARRRMTITLFVAQSFYSAALIAPFTLMSILAAQLSGSDSAAGLPSTASLVGRALAAYPIGWLMDRIGRRFGLSLGYGLGTVGLVVAAWSILVSSFLWFLVGVTLFGMGRGASEQSRYVVAEIQVREKRAKAIGWIVFAGTVGAVGGPLLVEPSGKLVARFGMLESMGPFVLGALLVFVGLILIWGLLRPDPKTIAVLEVPETTPVSGNSSSFWRLLSDGRVLLALSSMTIGQLVMTFIMVITPLHMSHLQHATREISFVIMAHTLGMFGLSWLTGSLIDRYGRITMIIVGALMLAAAAALTPVSDGVPLLAVALFLLGWGWNFCFVAGSSLLSDAVAASDKGRMQGASEVIVALASGGGSLSSGAVFASGGILVVSGVALSVTLALLAGVAWSSWSQRAPAEAA